MEKGTRVLGEYSGGFSQGEHRIFVLWNRAITPAGISVNLGSPAADQLGRAGMGGRIDTFFWERFGGALLLSIVGDAGDAVSNRVSGVDKSEEHTSELQSIMRISYAVFCLKKKKKKTQNRKRISKRTPI